MGGPGQCDAYGQSAPAAPQQHARGPHSRGGMGLADPAVIIATRAGNANGSTPDKRRQLTAPSFFHCKLIQKSREGYFASVFCRCLGLVTAIADFHSHGPAAPPQFPAPTTETVAGFEGHDVIICLRCHEIGLATPDKRQRRNPRRVIRPTVAPLRWMA